MTLTEELVHSTTPLSDSAPWHWSGASLDSDWLERARALVNPLRSRAASASDSGRFAAESYADVREAGFTSMLVPAELGGGGASFAELCGALATLAHGCPSTALTLSMHSHLVAAQVWRHHRGLPAPVLGKVAAGAVLVSTGASDWMASNGSCHVVEGGYRVSARKAPASGAPGGDIVVTSIRWDDAPGGPQVLHFAVPVSAPGVSVETTWDAHGMRATGSDTVVFDDVFVSAEAISLARPADRWHPVWSTVVGVAMPLIMSVYAGVAERAAEVALELAGRRSVPSAPSVGRMLRRLSAARDTVGVMARSADDCRFDNTDAHAAVTLARKVTAGEAVLDTVRLALEVGGGAAFGRSSEIGRLLDDAHGLLYHPVPTDQQESFTGRVGLGLDPLD